MRAISSLEVFLCSKAKICDLCCEVNCLYISNTKLVNLRETSVSIFILYCQYVLLLTIGKTKRRVGEKRNVGKSEKRNVVKIKTKRSEILTRDAKINTKKEASPTR